MKAFLWTFTFLVIFSCDTSSHRSFYYLDQVDNVILTAEEYKNNSKGVIVDYKNWQSVIHSVFQDLINNTNFEVFILRKDSFNVAFFPKNQFFINTATLDTLENESINLASSFSELKTCKNLSECRKVLILPIIAHELAHYFQDDYFLLKNKIEEHKHLPRDEFYEKILLYKRERELSADLYAQSILARNGKNPNLILLPLKILKKTNQEKNTDTFNRIDYYTSSHPSPNERFYHITEREGYKTLKELELAFHLIAKGSSIEELKLAINLIENHSKKFPNNLELKRAKATAYHRYWIYTSGMKDLKFIPIIDQPLFSDSEEFNTFKTPFEIQRDSKLYQKTISLYEEIFEKIKDNDPGFISNYSLLLTYSPLEANRKRSLDLAIEAFKKKKSRKILNNLGIVFFLNGKIFEAQKSFWSGMSEMDRENVKKTIGERLENVSFQLEQTKGNVEQEENYRSIAISNFTFMKMYTKTLNPDAKSELKKMQKYYFSLGAKPSPWVIYLNDYVNQIH